MAGQTITFEFLSRGAASLARDFSSIGTDSGLASRGVKVLSDVIERLGDKTNRTAAESKLLAGALRQTGEAADRETAKLVLADAAIRRLGDAEQDASKKSDGLGKALGGLKWNPGLAGPALALAPAIATLGGAVAGVGVALGGAFVAGAGALAAFGAVAKPVFSDAQKAAQAVEKAQNNYNIAIANGVKPAAAYKAEQIAIGKAYADMSPQQIALSKQLGVMAKAWQDLKAAQTPVVAGALQPWLKSVTDLTKQLGPIIAAVAPVIKGLGTQFDALINSPAFTKFRDFIAGTGSAAVSAAGGTIIDLVKSFMILLPKFDPLIREAVGWISRLGPAVLAWAQSKKASDDITKFMAWFSTNGPVVGGLLKNIGGALKALAPGLTSGGLLELKVISDFLGLVAKLPPNLAKPLVETAGALLLLQKLGVISVGIKFVGMGAAAAGTAAGAEAGSAAASALGGGLIAGGAAIGAGFILAVRKAIETGWKGILGLLPQLFSGVGGILNISATGWTNAILDHFSKPIHRMWDELGHFLASSFDVTRHQVAATADSLGHYVAGSFDTTRRQVTSIWNDLWLNTITRTARGFHDIAGWFDTGRHQIAAALDQIRAGAVAAWNTIWANTVSRVANGIATVVTWFAGLPGKVLSVLSSLGGKLLSWAAGVMGDMFSGFKSVWQTILDFFKNLPADILHAIGVHSMPGWAVEAGKWIMKGLGFGITAHLQSLVLNAKQIASAVSGALGGDAGANKALARKMFPWPASMWPDFDYLEMREAGYNRFARNPSSGAYGIPQALPESKLPFAGQAAGGSHAGAQLSWMFSYIAGRYGNPVNAAAHERAFNWYGGGTPWAMPGWAVVGERGMELVNFRGGEQVIPASWRKPAPAQGSPHEGLQEMVAEIRALRAEVRELNRTAAAIPARTGQHVGAAVGGVGADAAFRRRYP